MAETKPSAPEVPHEWHQELPPDVDSQMLTRRQWRLFPVVAVLLLLLGLSLGLASWVTSVPHPYFLPITVANYADLQLPPVYTARRDIALLEDDDAFSTAKLLTISSSERHTIVEALGALRFREESDRVVVYLTCRAGSSATNEVFLLPSDAQAAMPETWIALTEVLHYLEKCPARHKLLVLDVLWPGADATFGILRNDVADCIEVALQSANPDLLILLPASRGQNAQASTELGQSIFGYYFREALKFADGYNVQQSRDGRVSVDELAAFVRQRVNRWARQNRTVEQTPILWGKGAPFDLAAVSPRRFQKQAELEPPLEYPQWLAAGWQYRDYWYEHQVYRFNPRGMSVLEANLLRLEEQFPFDNDPGQLEATWKTTEHSLVQQLKKSQAQVPSPQPTSLARLQAQEHPVDPAVVAAVSDFMTQFAATLAQPPAKADPARLKLVQGLRKKLGGKSAYDLAIALFDSLVAMDSLDPTTIRWVDATIRPEQPEPLFVETHFLRRMAALAGEIPPSQWPADLARTAFRVVSQGEDAVRYTRPLRWMEPLLGPVAQQRHNGILLLNSYGYSSPQSAATYLNAALAGYGETLALQDLLVKAYAARDRALWFLPNYTRMLPVDARYCEIWCQATRNTAELADVLEPSGDAKSLTEVDLTTWLEDLRQSTLRVQNSLSALDQPFTKTNVDRLVNEANQTEVSAALWTEIHAILTTCLMPSEERMALWKARQQVSRTLAERTLALDNAENFDSKFRFTPMLDPGSDPQGHAFALRRAHWSIHLLELGGYNPAAVANLVKLYKEAFGVSPDCMPGDANCNNRMGCLPAGTQTSPQSEAQLAQQLAETWNQLLPQYFEDSTDFTHAARLSKVFPAWLPADALDSPTKNPGVCEYVEQCRTRWRWLAEQYRYAARDGGGATFYAEAARRLSNLVNVPAETYVQFFGPSLPLDLSNKDPDVRSRLPWKLVGPDKTKGPVKVTCFSPNTSVLGTQILNDPKTPGVPVSFEVSLLPGFQSADLSMMRGIVLQIEVAGRTFHDFVSLPDLAGTQQFEVLLGTTPVAPDPSLTRLRLRPVVNLQNYYLFVRNPTSTPRQVTVELTTGPATSGDIQQIKATATATIPARQTQRITFAGDPAPADKPLPEIAGPIDVTVIDAVTAATSTDTQPKVLGHRAIPVEIADPRAYVQCDSAVFNPGGGVKPNQLSLILQASEMPAGPPCVVQLVLPADRIPGFAGAARGSFRGVLAPTGSPLTLFAQGLRLGEGDGGPSYFYLTVDNCTRALVFQATLPHSGQPTTPQLQITPALRINAPQLALASPQFNFLLEADEAPSTATLEVQLGQTLASGVYTGEVTQRYPTARHHRIGFAPVGAAKELSFSAAIEDWQPAINTTGIVGKRKLRCRLLGPDGSTICMAEQSLVLDNSPPDISPLVSLPALAGATTELKVNVIATDDLSGVADVMVFVGKPENGQPPKGAKIAIAEKSPLSPNSWQATLKLPEDVGPATITALATNGVGLSQTISSTLEVVPAASLADGKIVGSVTEGSRPQPNLAVVLMSGANQVAKTTTSSTGQFVFPQVKPGSYKVNASKPSSLRKGESDVEVQSGQTAQSNISLAL